MRTRRRARERIALLVGLGLSCLASGCKDSASSNADAPAVTSVRVCWPTRTLSMTAAPFALAEERGWARAAGLSLELIPMPGSAECVKTVATGEVDVGLVSIEPLAAAVRQGLDARVFYTAYRRNIYSLAVPEKSDIRSVAQLKGKRVGVSSMSSSGVVVARALARAAGLDPERDLQLVVAGEGALTAALLRKGELDALSQWDTQYAMVENAGIELRELRDEALARFPANGFIANGRALAQRADLLVKVAGLYARGTAETLADPEAAARATWKVYPQTRPTGDEAPALVQARAVIDSRAEVWRLEDSARWGESSPTAYQAYLEFLVEQGVLASNVPADKIIDNSLIDRIHAFVGASGPGEK